MARSWSHRSLTSGSDALEDDGVPLQVGPDQVPDLSAALVEDGRFVGRYWNRGRSL